MVQHDAHPRGFRGACVHQPLHRVGAAELGPLRRHLHLPPARGSPKSQRWRVPLRSYSSS